MKINELEKQLGVSRSTIRYYEEQGLVTPPRQENGYRDYSDEDARLFQKIIVLRKLGVGIPEIKDLIKGGADLHDVLDHNVETLRSQQSEISSMIEMCEKLGNEADDFAGIDPPKYLKQIYEDEQKGAQFAEAKEITFRDLDVSIALLGALFGMAIPQNNPHSKHSGPIPDDIRGNKKEGKEYDTIGDVLAEGGIRKVIVIAVIVLFVGVGIINGLFLWGWNGSNIKYMFDFNKSGITTVEPDTEELEELKRIDPDVAEANEFYGIYYGPFKFHSKDGILITLRHSEDGKWIELGREEIDSEEGYLFITGDPSSDIVLHIIADGSGIKKTISIDDSAYTDEENNDIFINSDEQIPLDEERMITLFYRMDSPWDDILWDDDGVFDDDIYSDILKEEPPDGGYAVVVQELK